MFRTKPEAPSVNPHFFFFLLLPNVSFLKSCFTPCFKALSCTHGNVLSTPLSQTIHSSTRHTQRYIPRDKKKKRERRGEKESRASSLVPNMHALSVKSSRIGFRVWLARHPPRISPNPRQKPSYPTAHQNTHQCSWKLL